MSDKIEVYNGITATAEDLAKIGISKDQKNQQQNYKFRGIDDVYNTLAPILSKNSLCIIPRVLTREVSERTNKKGTILFYINLDVEFDIVSSIDGSMHTARVSGEAMDSGDKATNKAMSAAYKYLCFQIFCIPTSGDNDADATTHEVKPLKDTTLESAEKRAKWEDEADKQTTIDSLGAWFKKNENKMHTELTESDWKALCKYVGFLKDDLNEKDN